MVRSRYLYIVGANIGGIDITMQNRSLTTLTRIDTIPVSLYTIVHSPQPLGDLDRWKVLSKEANLEVLAEKALLIDKRRKDVLRLAWR
jgi:hypothetical protein